MPSYNRVILIGRLTREPELKYTAGGLAVTTFSIAVDRKFKNQQGERQTDFFRCKAWRQKAEFVANYVGKGRLVAIDGSIETSEVTGQDGQKRYFTDIICDNVETLDAPRDAEGGAPGGGNGGYGAAAPAGGNAGGAGYGGGARGGAPANDDNGYFPDEDVAPAPPRGGANAAGRGPAGGPTGGGNAGGGYGAGARGAAGGNAGGGRPAPQPAPAYPEDDFDDSDPFADQ